MRTPALLLAQRELSVLNAHYSLSMFVFEEFQKTLEKTTPADRVRFTSDLFRENKMSRLYNVPVQELGHEIAHHQTTLFVLFGSRCSEVAKDYFEWIETFLSELSGRIMSPDNQKPYFERLANLAGRKGSDLFQNEIIWTLDHLRQRRNCLVHRNAEANKEFRFTTRNHGTSLNNFWSETMPDRSIDFRSAAPAEISPDAFLYLLRTTRYCLEQFDRRLCVGLPIADLERHLRGKFDSAMVKRKAPPHPDTVERKFKLFCSLEFGGI
jgi:hypothetical protein